MREKILNYIETNSRIDIHDLAIMMGTDETTIMNELEEMEYGYVDTRHAIARTVFCSIFGGCLESPEHVVCRLPFHQLQL